MQIIGFNFTKIAAEKVSSFKDGKISSNIEFKDILKDKVDLLKDSDAIKINFTYNLDYEVENKKDSKTKKSGQVAFEGNLIISTTKDETKDILKHWKKKEISPNMKIPLFNLIMKRCASRSLQLQEDIGLPSHIQVPRLQAKPSN